MIHFNGIHAIWENNNMWIMPLDTHQCRNLTHPIANSTQKFSANNMTIKKQTIFDVTNHLSSIRGDMTMSKQGIGYDESCLC